MRDADAVIRHRAASDIRSWLGTQYYLPPAAPPDIAELLDRAADLLSERTIRELRFLLAPPK